jgi:hypothetical protein
VDVAAGLTHITYVVVAIGYALGDAIAATLAAKAWRDM